MKFQRKASIFFISIFITLIIQLKLISKPVWDIFISTKPPRTQLFANYEMHLDKFRRLLDSDCICRADDTICLKIDTNNDYNIIVNELTNQTQAYKMRKHDFENSYIACNPFSVLRRGQNQKVISYSILDENFDVQHLRNLITSAYEYFPGWTIRIYHNGTIHKSTQCEFECLKNSKTGNLYDNIDFCDLNEFAYVDLEVTHLMSTFWRWLPVADLFVDTFLSRDFDSCIGEREYLSVNEWLQSNTLFHIMRGTNSFLKLN